MTGGDRQEPLWASSLARQSERLDDVVVRWEREEPEVSAPGADGQQPVRWRVVAVGVLAVVVAVALAAALPGGGSVTVEDVPSYWGDVTMTCRTTRLEQDDRAVELFRCHAVAGGTLRSGDYRSPEARWSSDITGREARANEIQISPDGELTGWAAY